MQNNKNNIARWLLLVLMLCLHMQTAQALTPVDTRIINQASASFKDDNGIAYTVTSNLVETVIQQVAALDLIQDQSKFASTGGEAYFPHSLKNTGNGDDTYDLAGTHLGGNFNFTAVTLYEDANQDGLPDDIATPIAESLTLAQDESYYFVAVALLPDGLAEGQAAQLSITANSRYDNNQTAINTDTVTVSNRAIIDVTKAISSNAGTSPSGAYTVTLTYINRGLQDATSVNLLDSLPAGMDYVASSAIWSVTGNGTSLSDATGDTQGSNPDSIQYCAYSGGCSDKVDAIISQVASGDRGTLQFDVMISAGLASQTLFNLASYQYNDGVALSVLQNTNQVPFEVIQIANVVANGSNNSDVDGSGEAITVTTASQGASSVFHDFIWNTGNGRDRFDIELDTAGSSFPSGTYFQLYRADGFSPLTDTDGNGIPDTGFINAASHLEVLIKAILPVDAVGNAGYGVTLTATSLLDDGKSNAAVNHLNEITSGSVDLTNNDAIGSANVAGVGAGPETAAVTTNSVAPANTTRFILYVNNSSASSDNYDLSASTDSSFANISLPANWRVQFVDGNGQALSNTGVIAANSAKLIYADVSIPANQSTGTTSLYFRVQSLNTGSSDIKHDAVTVGEVKDLVLQPNNQGQVLPGGSIVYSHSLINQGNADQNTIQLIITNSENTWNTVLYEDNDSDGQLSGGDAAIDSVALLIAGESKLIFAKVYAPATAPMGVSNVSTITASWNTGADSTQAEDVTTTNRSDVSIVKEQALDSDCDGVADNGFGLDQFAVDPNQCVLYRLTATNTGAETLYNVKIQDATPAFTSFIADGGLPSVSQGSLASTINAGSSGSVVGNMGQVDAGYTAVLIFGIQVD